MRREDKVVAPKKAVKKEAKEKSFVRKIVLAAVLGVVVLALLIALPIVNYYASLGSFVDPETNIKYTVKPSGSGYVILDPDGKELEKTPDGKYFCIDDSNVLKVDADGTVTKLDLVDREGEEERDGAIANGILMYEMVSLDNVVSIEVVNKHGSYKLADTGTGDFGVVGFPGAPIEPEKLSSLVVSCGYTYSLYKVPVSEVEKRGLEEYGLGERSKIQFTITYKKDNKEITRTVFIGDRVQTGSGYYAQLEGRENRVYILTSVIEETLLTPVEELLVPRVFYPMGIQDYFDVSNFVLWRNVFDENGEPVFDGEMQKDEPIVAFSYISLDERRNTAYETMPFKMNAGSPLAGYTPWEENVMTVLRALQNPDYVGVKSIDASDEDKKEFGLENPAYGIFYVYNKPAKDSNGNNTIHKYKHSISISKRTDTGTYYVMSDVFVDDDGSGAFTLVPGFTQIVEIKGYVLEFLEWSDTKWIETRYDAIGIGFIDSIELASPEYNATFKFETTHEKNVESNGNISFTHSLDAVIATDSTGKYTLNDERFGVDKSKSLLQWFRHFCKTRTATQIIGSTDISGEDFAALTSNPDNHLLTLKIKYAVAANSDGQPTEYETKIFSFYRYSDLKSYVSVEIEGSETGRVKPFLVASERVEYMIQNAQKAIKGETIVND